jgi:hypothetical protein
MDTSVLATIIQEGGKLISSFLQTYGIRQRAPAPLSIASVQSGGVTTEQTIQYQKRELAKELLLLEGHLGQGCKIDGIPCDCCSKHPIKIEGLALETSGMSKDPVFGKLAAWAQTLSPMTGENASASGEYDNVYSKLAMEAREFRKTMMAQEEVKDRKVSTGELPTTTQV